VLRGESKATLLEDYNEERGLGADENLLNSSRATDFMTPRSAGARALQTAVLELAREFPFARALINSGRLSVPCALEGMRSITPDPDGHAADFPRPGQVMLDAPVRVAGQDSWLLRLCGPHFTCLCVGTTPPDSVPAGMRVLVAGQDFEDAQGIVFARYATRGPATYLIRPDQHIAARFGAASTSALAAAWRRCLAFPD
jgi:3-(3-hydroxy-phenyl)propionate hydroxylase